MKIITGHLGGGFRGFGGEVFADRPIIITPKTLVLIVWVVVGWLAEYLPFYFMLLAL